MQFFFSENSAANIFFVCPNIIGGGPGGGQDKPRDEKFSEKWPCSHNNNTALIKQKSQFDTASVMTNT